MVRLAMAITRSATALLPATDLVAIRTRLAEQYGSELYEADDDRRILCIHVPRAEPDPVNDVEAAVEYLDPTDVGAATQVLLIGTQRMAQVYAEPLKQLVQERVRTDQRIADEWRQRLPGTLSHEFFKDPADPRRRSRLVVRLPVGSMAEVEDSLLEPLADELGPQVDTPRVKSLAAVYLISARDHVRLAPDVFIQELLRKWRDEDRRMRAQAARELEKQAERERKEIERRRLMADLDRTLGRSERVARAPLRRHQTPSNRVDSLLGHGRHLDLTPGTRLSARTLAEQKQPSTSNEPPGATQDHDSGHTGAREHRFGTNYQYLDAVLGRGAPAGQDSATPGHFGATPPSPRAQEPALGTKEPAPPLARTPSSGPRSQVAGTPRSAPEPSYPRAALASTDDVIQTRGPSRGPSSASRSTAHPSRATPAATPASSQAASSSGPAAETAVVEHNHRMERIKNRVDGLGKRAVELNDRPGGRLGRIAEHLMDCGFDVLVRPETPGARIDLAAERPEGNPQRIVLRLEDKLTVAAANKGLELARTLDVDQVVVVAEHADPEAERRLLATKVQWLTPTDLAKARL